MIGKVSLFILGHANRDLVRLYVIPLKQHRTHDTLGNLHIRVSHCVSNFRQAIQIFLPYKSVILHCSKLSFIKFNCETIFNSASLWRCFCLRNSLTVYLFWHFPNVMVCPQKEIWSSVTMPMSNMPRGRCGQLGPSPCHFQSHDVRACLVLCP